MKNSLKVGVSANTLPVLLGGNTVRALGRSPLRSALEASAVNDHILVIVQLAGGNDGLNTLVPISSTEYYSLRPTLGLKKADAGLFTLADHDTLAWNGRMTGMADLYAAGKVAALQNVGYANPDLSHFRGTDIWNTATDARMFANTGWIGRLLGDLNPNYPPAEIPKGSQPLAVQFGNSLSNAFLGKNGGMGIVINQLPTQNNASIHNYDAIPSNPSNPYLELDYVRTIQKETEVYTQTLIDRSVKTNKVTYPTGNTLATQLASVAQCIASGFSTKVYLVTQTGYDTHSNQANDHPTLLGNLSAAITAFQQDLEASGLADKVVTMTYSEFGRRPQENGGGTDHGTAAPLFVIGTQVKGGVRGSDPNLTALVSKNLVFEAQHDFRNVYASIMTEWLEIDSTEVTQVLTKSGSETFSSNANWLNLGIIKDKPQQAVYADGAPGLMLMQNYPNPCQDRTAIEFALPANGRVELSVWNMKGEEIARVADQVMSAGTYRESFNTSRLANGTYLYRLKTTTGEVTRQLVVQR